LSVPAGARLASGTAVVQPAESLPGGASSSGSACAGR
jgi:hypothetical protein